MIGQRCTQVLAVVRLEMRKTFLARRGLWIYILAFAPVLLYVGHAVHAPRERQRLAREAEAHPVSRQTLDSIQKEITRDQVVEKLGEPYWQDTRDYPRENGKKRTRTRYKYTDGQRDTTFHFWDDKLTWTQRRDLDTLAKSQLIFATSFQFYFLRLAVFFGCVGIFINLFRGELLDKSLHFYLLTPMRREVLLAGKYLAGLLATVVIFSSSTTLQWLAMLWQFEWDSISSFLTESGWAQLRGYVGVTALACVGYGSVFLAVGLLFRNPVIPTAVVLLWESINPFLPPLLKKISMIFYLQSLCPVAAPPDAKLPPLMHLLISPTLPATQSTAILCIALLTLIVLVLAGCLARKLEINYSTD
jgi:hypothetical protein